MKLSDYKDEEALELLADLLEPVAEILSDKAILAAMQAKEINKMGAIKYAIKQHKKSVIEVLAILEGVPVNEYHCNVFTLPVKLLEILNDPELMDFFKLQVQGMTEEESFGSATEVTQAKRK